MAASSAHFKAREFACPHCGVSLVRPLLLTCLERLRAHVGHPLPLIDGYRCPVHNSAIGGASDSQHMYGAAADLAQGLASPRAAQHAGFTGVGVRNGWAVHVDVRDGPFTRWSE